MSASQYHHGFELVEHGDAYMPIRTVRSATIGLVGTAPNADPDLFPINKCVPLFSDARNAELLKSDGTLLDSIDDIYNQIGANVVVCRVAEGNDMAANWSNVMGDYATKTGVNAFLTANSELGISPKLLIAPGFTSGRPTDGVKSVTIGNAGSGYGELNTVVTISGDGQGAKGVANVINGSIESVSITNPGFGYTAATIAFTGTGADATGTVELDTAANPVTSEMDSVAGRLAACCIADGPNTTDADAIQYRGDFGSDRIMVVDPHLKTWDRRLNAYKTMPGSAVAAGLQAKVDNDEGFWVPFSNHAINGVGGVSRHVQFNVSDPNSEAVYLNSNEVTSVVRDDGYRFWGLRTCSDNPNTAFWSVRRTIDAINSSIKEASRPWLDKAIDPHDAADIIASVNDYLLSLEDRRGIVGGKAWFDPSNNPVNQLRQGILEIEWSYEPKPPIEHLIGNHHRDARALDLLAQQIEREVRTRQQINTFSSEFI